MTTTENHASNVRRVAAMLEPFTPAAGMDIVGELRAAADALAADPPSIAPDRGRFIVLVDRPGTRTGPYTSTSADKLPAAVARAIGAGYRIAGITCPQAAPAPDEHHPEPATEPEPAWGMPHRTPAIGATPDGHPYESGDTGERYTVEGDDAYGWTILNYGSLSENPRMYESRESAQQRADTLNSREPASPAAEPEPDRGMFYRTPVTVTTPAGHVAAYTVETVTPVAESVAVTPLVMPGSPDVAHWRVPRELVTAGVTGEVPITAALDAVGERLPMVHAPFDPEGPPPSLSDALRDARAELATDHPGDDATDILGRLVAALTAHGIGEEA